MCAFSSHFHCETDRVSLPSVNIDEDLVLCYKGHLLIEKCGLLPEKIINISASLNCATTQLFSIEVLCINMHKVLVICHSSCFSCHLFASLSSLKK